MAGRLITSVVLGCCLGCLVTKSANADDSPGQGADDIRDSARDILDGAEFRQFRRILRENGDGNRKSSSKGQGGNGSNGEGGSGQGTEKSGDRQNSEDDNDESQSEDSDSNSAGSWFPSGAMGGIGAVFGQVYVVLAWLLVAAIVGLMLYLIIQALRSDVENSDQLDVSSETLIGDEPEPERAPGELPADVYIQAARKLAAAGRYREAIGQLLLGAMSHIERSELIRFRRGLTHRDYLRAVRGKEHIYAGMRSIVRTYEPIGFGRRPATQQHFDESLRGYEAGFRATSEAN